MHLSCFKQAVSRGIFFVASLVAYPSVLSSQIMGFFPPVDSISVLGSCTPPMLICRVVNVDGGVDTIDIRPTSGEDHMYAGSSSDPRISNCFFAVRDSFNLNQYQLCLLPDEGDRQIINFGSSFFVMGGFFLRLRVDTGSGSPDSAQARFYADATGAVGSAGSGLPTATRLLPNFPNPFNPSTTVSYELGTRSRVTLNVFDVLGREVATLVNRIEEPGLRSAQLDARELGSGVYFYCLSVGGVVQTRKMILQK